MKRYGQNSITTVKRQWKQRNLGQFLDNAPGDAILYITAGSGFFYIGDKVGFYEKQSGIEKNLKKQLKNSFTNFNRQYNTVLTNGKALAIKRQKKLLDNAQKRLDEQILPLTNRKVLDVYKRATGGYAIKIEGTEQGKYWTQEEYDNGSRSKISKRTDREDILVSSGQEACNSNYSQDWHGR